LGSGRYFRVYDIPRLNNYGKLSFMMAFRLFRLIKASTLYVDSFNGGAFQKSFLFQQPLGSSRYKKMVMFFQS
ncbi:MAG: hypothetical protein ABGW78_16615, partial [Pirellulales bacterium]